MIVVGLLYNRNGMATWCIEAALALHNCGQSVTLVIDEQQRQDLKKCVFPHPVLWWKFESIPKTSFAGRIKNKLYRLLKKNSIGFSSKIETILKNQGITPTVFLLNQSDLFDIGCKTPQYVVGWAYPVTLGGYLNKTLKQNLSPFQPTTYFSLLNAFTWYKKDWYAYKNASGVLAVSNRLKIQLETSRVNTYLVYPPLNIKLKILEQTPTKKIKLLFAAVDLENSQKKIQWGLESLLKVKKIEEVEIHLVGNYTFLKEKTQEIGLKAIFHGLLSREKLSDLMSECDIFIFCSAYDDWGYVQVEAMSTGMVVIAPEISPSDEIIEDKNLLFQPNDKQSFIEKIEKLVDHRNLFKYKQYCRERSQIFGQESFTNHIISIKS